MLATFLRWFLGPFILWIAVVMLVNSPGWLLGIVAAIVAVPLGGFLYGVVQALLYPAGRERVDR
ncbi:hypothetical protein [Sandarakinorhabdus rubra]|uniref:hypothetical protein n=1 Tax=Sandarakinorhabdus rubra TaxID=2672568 RepID=UPI0013DBAF13|nr:hypothetical protein [Sandarakinorhabdus rubra]